MEIKFAHFRKRYLRLFLISILVFFVFAYWLKMQMEIDFFHSFSLGSHFPLKYLINDVIESSKPGVLLEENFNKEGIFPTWSRLWMKEPGTVTKELSLDGVDGSECLLIRNTGRGSWVYQHRKRVQVRKGDIFGYIGEVNIRGKKLFAEISVVAYDKNKKAFNYGLFKKMINRTGVWVTVEKQFTISDDDIKYITLRLDARGYGEFRFDNLIFRKIK